QKQEIIFKGLKSGQTSVIVRDTIGDIRARFKVKITMSNQSQTVSELREFLGDVEGLNIGIKGGKVFVGGEIVVPTDLGRIFTVMESYSDVIKLYDLSPQT